MAQHADTARGGLNRKLEQSDLVDFCREVTDL